MCACIVCLLSGCAINMYAPFVWCDCVRTVLWYLCTGCVISGCIRTVVLCASLWLCVYVPFVWYLCVWIVCAYMCVHAVGVISVCMYRLRVMSVYTHRFPDSCMYVSFVLLHPDTDGEAHLQTCLVPILFYFVCVWSCSVLLSCMHLVCGSVCPCWPYVCLIIFLCGCIYKYMRRGGRPNW